MPRPTLAALALGVIVLAAPGRAETSAGSPARLSAQMSAQVSGDASPGARHASWQDCLHEAFALRAGLSSPDNAADAALRACRPSEAAYLDALALSPLADDEDVARIRPALVARARSRLLGTRQL